MWCSCCPWCVTGNMSKYPICNMNECVFAFLWVFFFFFQPGWFLLSSSQHLNHSSVAHVLSEWIHLRETVCFSLWYHMNSRSEKRKKQNCTTRVSGGVLLFILFSFLISFLGKCHLVLNHLLLCARVICVRVEALDRSAVRQRIQVKLEHSFSGSILKTWRLVLQYLAVLQKLLGSQYF